MRPGPGALGACLALLGLLALVATGIGAVGADDPDWTAATVVPNATTVEAESVNATSARLVGTVTADGDDTGGVAWIEYRERPTDGEWVRTRAFEFTVEGRSAAHWRFARNATQLRSGTTYEYRVLVATANGTDAGAVKTFTTNGSSERGVETTPTRTPTPICPSYRGWTSSLCTTTPTPTAPSGGGSVDEGRVSGAHENPADWLAGLLALLAWVGAVTVLAPAVLGGLVGVLSGGDEGQP